MRSGSCVERIARLRELMEPFVRQYGGGALRRVEQAVRIHLHLEQRCSPIRAEADLPVLSRSSATPYLDKG
jgi:hypothetical protein